jgi:membrane protease YdiL (CAAX protease family)
VLYGEFGEAWPLSWVTNLSFVPKGPGIKGGGIATLGAGVGVVGSFAVAIFFVIVFGTSSAASSNPWYLLASEIPLWAGFFGAVLVASRLHGSKSLAADFGLSWPTWKDFRLGVAGGVIGRLWPLFILVLSVAASSQGFGQQSSAAPRILGVTPNGVTSWTVVVLMTVVGAPFFEELFFRGLVQGALTRRVGATPALFITALGFAFIHVTDEGVLAPILLFPVALILGYLRKRSGRLAPGMVAHAMFNASLLLLFVVPAFR